MSARLLRNRNARIVATLGPASSDYETIKSLFLAGADVFRLNFSHSTKEEHKQVASIIRKVEKDVGYPIGILMDLQGPKIRIGLFEENSVSLKKGDMFILDQDVSLGDARRISLPHPEIFSSLLEGTILVLDDGKMSLKVTKNLGASVETEVLTSGVLKSKKGLTPVGVQLPISALTSKDKSDISIVEDVDADFVAVSFVQTAEDINYARSLIKKDVSIIAKIEKRLALDNIDEIINVSDGIMIARGDLGIEIPVENIPEIQRDIIRKSRLAKKPVIVATQMLESMVTNPVPTRAEVTDIDYSIRSGADAVMLSAESASGDYPVEAVSVMHKVIKRTESDASEKHLYLYSDSAVDKSGTRETSMNTNVALARGLKEIASSAGIKYIAAFTESGRTALNVSHTRPQATIVALTPKESVARQLTLVWGITSLIVDELYSIIQILKVVQESMKKVLDENERPQKVLIVGGIPFRVSGNTNFIHITDV